MGTAMSGIANPIPEIKKLREALEKSTKQTDMHNKILIVLTVALIVLTVVLVVLTCFQIQYTQMQTQPALIIDTTLESVKLGEDYVWFWVYNTGTTELWLNTMYDLELWCGGEKQKKLDVANLLKEGDTFTNKIKIGESRQYRTANRIDAGKMFYEGKEPCYMRIYVESRTPKVAAEKWIPVELPEEK